MRLRYRLTSGSSPSSSNTFNNPWRAASSPKLRSFCINCSSRSNVSDYSYEVDLYLVDVGTGEMVRTRSGAYDIDGAARELLPKRLAQRQ